MRLDQADWPMFGWITDMRPSLALARHERQALVLGTLVRVQGPSPRPVGSQMAFNQSKAIGYFSGGCLEADLANHARDVLADGEPRILIYGKGSPWIDIRLLCGGTLEIALERIGPDDPAVAALLELAGARKRGWWISDGRLRRVESAATFTSGPSGHYVVRHDPPWRLFIVGGDPVALATAHLALAAEFETTIIRPDGPGTTTPIQGIAYSRKNAATAIEDLQPDRWTAVVCATHDDEIDDMAIIAALRADTAYVGVLGSALRSSARRERLSRAGLHANRIAALHSPIGAVRSGKAPWEVAVSIVAEIMQVRSGLP